MAMSRLFDKQLQVSMSLLLTVVKETCQKNYDSLLNHVNP